VLAMACFHLERNEEAREWLKHCETWIDSSPRHVALAFQGNRSAGRYLGSPEWIMAHVLTREAKSLIDGPEALANQERNLSNRYAELRRNISETAKKQRHKSGKPMSNKKPVDNSPDVDLDSAKDNGRESVTKQ
jgi:hypothetical protein